MTAAVHANRLHGEPNFKLRPSKLKLSLVEASTLKRRYSGESSVKGEAWRRSSVRANTGWTERAAHKSRLCLERRSGKRTRSSETAAESVRDERAGCGRCCFSDRWDLPIQVAGWELECDRVPSMFFSTWCASIFRQFLFHKNGSVRWPTYSPPRAANRLWSTCVRSIKGKLPLIFRIKACTFRSRPRVYIATTYWRLLLLRSL